MSDYTYEKHDWTNGETITEELLDHMEEGIYEANSRAMTPGPAGAAGTNGTNATITGATATVDNTSSDSPACQVTLGGTESARTFAFAFTGIKGAKGDTGDTGAQGEPGPAGAGLTGTAQAIEALAGTEDAPAICTKVNEIITQLEARGVFAAATVQTASLKSTKLK